MSAKDAEIEKLKAQLAEANSVKTEDKKEVSEDIEVLRELYTEKFDGKDVPARYKNDANWLTKKINE